ncbi:MAG: hypothetical protein K6E50_10675 [Lachnospiraceae bacterium]|nr:hypothetical protein [Lachnospiraceae bacterium]
MNPEDFKYVLQEFSRTMIGARYTYGELLGAERVPFKFQTIIDRLILPYSSSDVMIGEHLLHLTPADKNYRIYENLKTKIKFFTPSADGGFKEKVVNLSGLAAEAEHWDERNVLQEVILSNMALMGFKL